MGIAKCVDSEAHTNSTSVEASRRVPLWERALWVLALLGLLGGAFLVPLAKAVHPQAAVDASVHYSGNSQL